MSFELGFEGGAEFGNIGNERSMFRGRGGTIRDKCKKSPHCPSLPEGHHAPERESVGAEPGDGRFWTRFCHTKEASWAHDCVVTGVQ